MMCPLSTKGLLGTTGNASLHLDLALEWDRGGGLVGVALSRDGAYSPGVVVGLCPPCGLTSLLSWPGARQPSDVATRFWPAGGVLFPCHDLQESPSEVGRSSFGSLQQPPGG